MRLQGAEDAVRRGRAEQDLLDDGLQAAQSTSLTTSDFRLISSLEHLLTSRLLLRSLAVRHRSLPELQRPAAEEVQPLAFLCARGE